jgi:hypothetical protein
MSLYFPYYLPYNKHNTNIHAPGGIRTHNPSKRAAVDPRLRPRCHWDRQNLLSLPGFETQIVQPVSVAPISTTLTRL